MSLASLNCIFLQVKSAQINDYIGPHLPVIFWDFWYHDLFSAVDKEDF